MADKIDEEELRAKERYRAFQRRFAKVLYWLFFILAVFLGGVQWVFASRGSSASFWTPLALYALGTAGALRQRRWVIALLCVLAAVWFVGAMRCEVQL